MSSSATEGSWIGLGRYFPALTTPQRDIDRSQIAAKRSKTSKVSREAHQSDGICSDSQHQESRKAEIRKRRQRARNETIANTDGRDIGEQNGRVMNEEMARHPGERDLLDAHCYSNDPVAMVKELQTHLKKRHRDPRRNKISQIMHGSTKTSDGPQPARINAYKAAGLGGRGLWSFSQRNKAKALGFIEPEPDINDIKLFDPRGGYSRLSAA